MGLDMYAYRMKAVSEELIKAVTGGNYEELCWDGPKGFDKEREHDMELFILPVGDADSNDRLDLANCSVIKRVSMLTPQINEERGDALYASKGIDKSYRICAVIENSEKRIVTFKNDEGIKKVTLTAEEIRSIYDMVPTECYIAWREEVGYWRKDYDLQDSLYDAYSREHDCKRSIENTGYHLCTEEMLAYMELDYPDKDEAIFYWEWY